MTQARAVNDKRSGPLLAIETSSRVASIALLHSASDIEMVSLDQPNQRPAQSLVQSIQLLLKRHHCPLEDCAGIAVSCGPGSFTGLRVGVVCAKTLAWATGLPLIAVDSLRVIAANSPPDQSQITVIAPAQRGGLYVGRYRQHEQTAAFTAHKPVHVVDDAQAWCAAHDVAETVSGPALKKCLPWLPANVKSLGERYWTPTAIHVAKIGLTQLEEKQTADVWSLEPFYLRRSSAEEQWDLKESRSEQPVSSAATKEKRGL